MTAINPDITAGEVHDNTVEDPTRVPRLILGDPTFSSVTKDVTDLALRPKAPLAWKIAFAISLSLLAYLMLLIGYLISTGVGIWGNNQPVAWAFDITNFVFWVGIGHAGTLISAVLFLMRQNWRTSVNRFAEAMTIFAVMCAGLFPAIHVGRAWLAYWLFPYPNQMGMWPQFRSPLLWDVFAVSTYATVSLLFWYVGMIPDLATLRDKAPTKLRQTLYGIFALGWRGSAHHWRRYEKAYLLLAGLATPLVLSVHSVVSFDFATSQLPGWHTTIFPPYFVAGAIYGGFAMVLVLAIPSRHFFGLKHIITPRHLDIMAKVMLGTGLIVTFAYTIEFFTAWYSQGQYELFAFANRATGPIAYAFWIMIACNVVLPQILWVKKFRQNPKILWTIAVIVNVGMWFERFVILLTLTRDFMPSSWGHFSPTWVDISMLIGSFGLFFTFFLLFVRYLPMVAMAEVKGVLPQAHSSECHASGASEYHA